MGWHGGWDAALGWQGLAGHHWGDKGLGDEGVWSWLLLCRRSQTVTAAGLWHQVHGMKQHAAGLEECKSSLPETIRCQTVIRKIAPSRRSGQGADQSIITTT